MRRLVVAALLTAALVPASAAQAKPIVPCGALANNGSGIHSIEVRALPCRIARTVARRWHNKNCDATDGPCRVRRMRCRSTDEGDGVLATRCVDGHMLVRFKSGS